MADSQKTEKNQNETGGAAKPVVPVPSTSGKCEILLKVWKKSKNFSVTHSVEKLIFC